MSSAGQTESRSEAERVSAKGIVSTYPPIKRSNPLVVLLALIVVLTLVSTAVLFIFSAHEKSSPKDPFLEFIEGGNEKDGGKMLNNTIMRFSSVYEQILSDMLNDPMEDSPTVKINSLYVLDNDALTQAQKDNASRFLSDIESGWGIDVEDYRYLSYNITETYHTTIGDRVEYSEDFILVFKIESEWYLVLPLGV